MNVTWKDGRLAVKQLFDALSLCNINPQTQTYCNLFYGHKGWKINRKVLAKIKSNKLPIVAMGNRVQDALSNEGVSFIPLVHPAARGKIRKKCLYASHVRSQLITA